MSTSTFLSLPGEIRNRIYGYCVEPKAIQLPRMPKRSEKPYEHVRFGLYGSLRNVSRQTRVEFGPMYLTKTVLVIHQVTANRFLYAFFPELTLHRVLVSERAQLGGVTGNIQIITYFGLRYDATPLVKLCAKYSTFKFAFTDASACLRLGCLVNDFVATISSVAFRPYLKRMSKVEITCSTRPEISLGILWTPEMDKAMRRVGDARQVLVKMGAPPMDEFAILCAPHQRSEPRA